MNCLIFSGGKSPNYKTVSKYLDDSKIIAADSGGEFLYNNRIKPDFLIGDFDSISQEALDYFIDLDVDLIRLNKDKDYTDTYIAVQKAIELKPDKIFIFGGTGTRLDHTLGNINILLYLLKKKIEAYIIDDNNMLFLSDKDIVINGNKNENLSLFSFGNKVSNLSIKNSKYELENYDLVFGDSLCISNEFLNKDININFDQGILLIMKTID
ncbi:MAG: thiamine diphosphokinase [Clostridiaceae bacterium]